MPAFYNRATLNYGGSAFDSNTVQGELNAALAVGKEAISAGYRPGDAVSFIVTLTNSGASEAAGLQLRDDLGAYPFGTGTRAPLEYLEGSARYFINGEPQAAPEPDAGGGSLTFRNLRVPAGGNAAILYAARVNEFAPLGEGAAITNTVRLDDATSASATVPANPNGTPANPSGTPANPNGANNSAPAGNSASIAMAQAFAQPQELSAAALPAFASAIILPEMAARLSIRKALSPRTVSPGESLTYTLTIENEGASAVGAGEGATVSDLFNPRMNITSVRFNGAEWSAPVNYSYDPNTGAFATAAGQLSVPAASFFQDPASGRWQTRPGASTIEITGTLR